MHPTAALCALHGLIVLRYVSLGEYRLVREFAPHALAIYHRRDGAYMHRWQGVTSIASELHGYTQVPFDTVPDAVWDCFKPEYLEELLEGRATM